MAADARDVFVTGGTGYIGQRLVSHLASRGHRVRVLARQSALGRVPAAATAIDGDALDAASIARALRPGDTIVHLVGTPHPNPSKAAQFERVDLASIVATTTAVRQVAPAHLIYVSVAHPAPVMQAYIAVRTRGEAAVTAIGCPATIVRPWYVLGPGHWWPVALIPVYAIARAIPKTRDGRHPIRSGDGQRHGVDSDRCRRASTRRRRADVQRARDQGVGKAPTLTRATCLGRRRKPCSDSCSATAANTNPNPTRAEADEFINH